MTGELVAPTSELVPSALVEGYRRGRERRKGAAVVAPERLFDERVAELYDRHASAVLGYFRAQGAAEPEDLLAEVFVQVTRDLTRFRGPEEAARGWVFAIARHRLIDERRRRAVRPHISGDPIPERMIASGEPEPVWDPDLVRALRALTPAQRDVLVLRFVADLSLRATAGVVRRRVGAVKALQARGLAHLARALSSP